jgi:hypothetical protein
MSSFLDVLFVFEQKETNPLFFVHHIFDSIQASNLYGNKTYEIFLHAPNEKEDVQITSEIGCLYPEIAQIIASSSFGGYFCLDCTERNEEHFISIHFNNLDKAFYLIISWRITLQNLEDIKDKAFCEYFNTYAKADKVFFSPNWLNSINFSDTMLDKVLKKQANYNLLEF